MLTNRSRFMRCRSHTTRRLATARAGRAFLQVPRPFVMIAGNFYDCRDDEAALFANPSVILFRVKFLV